MLVTPPAPTPLPRPFGAVRFRAARPEGLLRRIYDYWLGRRGAGAGTLPRRADIDPVDIPDLLHAVILVDVAGEPARFRQRLVGSSIVAREGHDTTGQWLEDILEPAVLDPVLSQYREAVASPRGLCTAIEFTGEDARLYRGQRLLLPLSCDGSRVNMLFGGSEFAPALPLHPQSGLPLQALCGA